MKRVDGKSKYTAWKVRLIAELVGAKFQEAALNLLRWESQHQRQERYIHQEQMSSKATLKAIVGQTRIPLSHA